MPEESTLTKAVQGGKWVSLGSISNKILGIASFFLLARFLEPAHYGVIAIIFMLSGIFNQMLITGFETAVMQKKEDVAKYLDPIWSFNIIKGLVVFLILYFTAPFFAAFFHAENSLELLRLSGIFVMIPSLASTKLLYLFRDFQFDKIYYRDTIGYISYIVVGALWVFFIGPDVWALFYANIARYIVPVFVIYYYFPQLPKFRMKFGVLKELIPYSKWIAGQNILEYCISLVDQFIIVRLLSTAMLGYYSKARNLSGVAYSPIGGISKNLSFVAFSKIQDNTEKTREGFLMTADLIFFFGVTNIFFIWFGAEAIIDFFLGTRWLPMVSALKILSVSSLLLSLIGVAYSMFDGSGKPRITFQAKIASVILYAALVYIGILYKSMVGAAIGVTLANVLVLISILYKMHRVYGIYVSSLLKRFALVCVPIFPVAALFFVINGLYQLKHSLFILCILTALYILFLCMFWFLGKKYERGCYQTMLIAFKILFPQWFTKKI